MEKVKAVDSVEVVTVGRYGGRRGVGDRARQGSNWGGQVVR